MIEIERHGSVAVLRMVHGKANTLDLEFCDAIVARFRELERDDDTGAVVLTGQGKMYSAGVDLPRLIDGGPDYVRAFLPALHRLYDTVFFHPKPVLAAVNGHAIAGGCVLACCADQRIAAAGDGRIGVTELQVGVPLPAMTFEVMRFATAPQYFPGVVLSGLTFPVDQARERGLVDEVVEPDAVMPRALKLAESLAALPPQTFAMTKLQIRQPVIDRMTSDGPRVDALTEKIWTAPETLERVRSFVARTLKKG